MRKLWTFHRRLIIAVIVVAIVGVSSAVVLAGIHPGGPRAARLRAPSHCLRQPGHVLGRHRTRGQRSNDARRRRHLAPTSIRPVPQTAIQRQIDAELAQAETPAAIAAAQRASVPAPAVSTAYPSVPTVGPERSGHLCRCVHHRALGHQFALQSRGRVVGLGRVRRGPQHFARGTRRCGRKGLVLSLADPDLPGGSPSPVPSAPQWAADAVASARASPTCKPRSTPIGRRSSRKVGNPVTR